MKKVNLQLFFLLVLLVCMVNTSAQSPVDFSKIDSERITSDPSVTWRQFGPGGSGNNYYLFWHPTNPNIVFQGPNMYNAYRSTNKGQTYDGILDYDGSGWYQGERGPIEINSPDFSRQNPKFGFCTREAYSHIFQTTNTGKTWSRRTDIEAQLEGQLINTIVVDPSDDNIWYMGSGTVNDVNHFFHTYANPHGFNKTVSNHKARIWKSTDKGDTWTNITPSGLNTDANITRIMVNPGNTDVVYAATTYGFYKSTDGGTTWTAKNKNINNKIIRSMDMHYNSSTGKVTLYVIDLVKYIPDGTTVRFNGGIYKSTDEGENWVKMNKNMPLGSDLMNSYTIKSSYYSIALANWFEKTDAQVKTLYPDVPTSMMHSVSTIRVDPTNANKVIVLNNYKSQFTFKGGMMWRSDNGGSSWFVTFRNGTKWEGDDKALWEARSNPTSHNITYRAQHEWENKDPYDQKAGATVEFNCDGSMIMYQVAKVVCVSTDGGDTWVENDEIDASSGQEHWVGAGNSNMPGRDIVTDPRNDFVYFCSGENSIWKTTDDGENVRPDAQAVYKMNIPNKTNPEECSVSSMVIHPTNKNTIYSVHFRQAYTGKLMMSTDGGANWVEKGKVIDPPGNMSLSEAGVTQFSLTIDPDNVNKFYVCIPSNPVDDITLTKLGDLPEPFGVYRSTNGGETFSKINNGFPAVANNKLNVQKLRLDPANAGVLYAAVTGQAGGLYKLNKNSTTWNAVNIPTGVTDVNDVFMTNDKLYISCGTAANTNANKGGVWVSEDRGTSWTQIFKCRFANHVRVASYDANVMLVSIPSSKMVNPGVYRTLDGGSTWQKINVGNLQSDRLSDLEIDEHQKGVYWCATYGAGMYKGTDPALMSASVSYASFQNQGSLKYMSSSDPVAMACDKTTVGATEKFIIEDLGGNLVAFKGSNGKYVSSENGTKTMTCSRDAVGAWEKFTMVDLGNNIYALKGNNDLYVRNSMLCTASSTGSWQQFKVVTGLKSASIAQVTPDEPEKDIQLYPNPASTVLNITGLGEGGNLISVYNMQGKVVMEEQAQAQDGLVQINVSELSTGLYIIRINGQKTKLLKFMKK